MAVANVVLASFDLDPKTGVGFTDAEEAAFAWALASASAFRLASAFSLSSANEANLHSRAAFKAGVEDNRLGAERGGGVKSGEQCHEPDGRFTLDPMAAFQLAPSSTTGRTAVAFASFRLNASEKPNSRIATALRPKEGHLGRFALGGGSLVGDAKRFNPGAVEEGNQGSPGAGGDHVAPCSETAQSRRLFS